MTKKLYKYMYMSTTGHLPSSVARGSGSRRAVSGSCSLLGRHDQWRTETRRGGGGEKGEGKRGRGVGGNWLPIHDKRGVLVIETRWRGERGEGREEGGRGGGGRGEGGGGKLATNT